MRKTVDEPKARTDVGCTELLGRDSMERDIRNKGGNDALMEAVSTMDYETLCVFHKSICSRPNAQGDSLPPGKENHGH